jgi:hypothetical protein
MATTIAAAAPRMTALTMPTRIEMLYVRINSSSSANVVSAQIQSPTVSTLWPSHSGACSTAIPQSVPTGECLALRRRRNGPNARAAHATERRRQVSKTPSGQKGEQNRAQDVSDGNHIDEVVPWPSTASRSHRLASGSPLPSCALIFVMAALHSQDGGSGCLAA